MRTPLTGRLLLAGTATTLTLLSLTPAGASSANISHSYKASSHIDAGSLVSLDATQPNYVDVANTANASRLIGVAVNSNDSLLAVDANNTDVQIATSGTASAIVSTLDGDIAVGDQVAVSPFNGIGKKAESGERIIGIAQTAFSAHSSGSSSRDVTDTAGHHKQIALGYVRLNIGIGTATNGGSADQLNSLQKIAQSITGRKVSTTRVVVSMVIALVALLALVALIYASIYSAIVSIGRNPLAKYAIFRSLGSVFAMAGVLTLIAVATIFFLLH